MRVRLIGAISDSSSRTASIEAHMTWQAVVASWFARQERFKVVFGDQPTASCLYRPELAGAQQVMAEFGEAANLARAARTGTTGIATATLTAHFHTMGGAGAGPVG